MDQKDHLQGAIEDANDFKNYLVNNLLIPLDNINNLCNEQATCSAIVKGFMQLQSNLEIKQGEVVIIIYFARHGAVARKPDKWTDWVTPSDKIEMLCPANINQDINGNKVEGIPD